MVMARPILTRLRARKTPPARSEPKIATRMTSARSRLRFCVPTFYQLIAKGALLIVAVMIQERQMRRAGEA